MIFRLVVLLTVSLSIFAETGADAWLRYRPTEDRRLPAVIVTLNQSEVESSAGQEIVRGVQGMFGRTLRFEKAPVSEDMIVLGTVKSAQSAFPDLSVPTDLIPDAYWLKSFLHNHHRVLLICATNDRGVLYGAFEFLRRLTLHGAIDQMQEENKPYQAIRWVNEWNNLDGSIERGYAGRSIFFADGNVVTDLTRARQYARLLASVGINGCAANNVNANPRVLTPEFLPQLVRLAAAFRPWGVQLFISVPFNSPKTVGGLDTFDPLNDQVRDWWKSKASELYRAIPDLGGFLVKADSEGQLGPSTYGRTHAEAANVMAEALRPYGGLVVYRGFVYNHHLDWHDLKSDRAKAAYDNFHPLDAHFLSNVILQIKYGPIDFQTREPVSPLLGALPQTNKAMELQITQEYTGQQRHLCYLVPMWKQMLDFDFHVEGGETPVRGLLKGLVGVSNVGLDANWMGSDLALANLYGFGRLAWDPTLTASQIISEWVSQTWGSDPQVDRTISDLELQSWSTYEGYTGPLGVGTLTDILHGHYGPGIETAENNGWGQWIRADHEGIGMDRTVATGTGFVGQYPPQVAANYETLERCPDNLLLFMHHVPYSHRLHSGKTVIQEVYDSHYLAAARVEKFIEQWKSLRGRIDPDRFDAVLSRLTYQAGHAVVWRDAICNWFFQQSGIADSEGRVGHYPNRIEAEDMQLDHYKTVDVTPWEDASGGRAISCADNEATCTASTEFNGAAGWYQIRVQYFDTTPGASAFHFFVGDQLIKTWMAGADLPWKAPNGDTSTRESVGLVALRPGDRIRIVGTPDQEDRASLDYLEILPVNEARMK